MRLKIFLLLIALGCIIFFLRTYQPGLMRKSPTENTTPARQVIFFSNRILDETSADINLSQPHLEDKIIKLIREPDQQKIIFTARLKKTSGQVLFLINLKGYLWLDEKSALTSQEKDGVTLADFKNALAFIDWKILDYWRAYPNFNDKNNRPEFSDIKITLSQEEKEEDGKGNLKSIDAFKAFKKENNPRAIGLTRIIFAGDPLLDDIILKYPSHDEKSDILPDCSSCAIFPSEKEIILRRYGSEWLTLDEKVLKEFDTRKPVKVCITIPRGTATYHDETH